MITRGFKQTSKIGRRLSFSISTPSLYSTSLSLTCSSEGSLGDSLFPVELLCRSSGGLGHSDIGLRSVDQSNPFYHHELYHHYQTILTGYFVLVWWATFGYTTKCAT